MSEIQNPTDSALSVSGSEPGSAGETPSEQWVLLTALEQLAARLEGEPEALLELLRNIEQTHRTIQDGPFRNSLPADRNALFRLLSEMERSGGWPYIPRLQLRTFMDLLQLDRPADDHPLVA
jgi:hypothetical protein